MTCSVCGQEGHNARTCTAIEAKPAPDDKKQVLWVRYDNISVAEADALLKENIDAKSKVAPTARATFAKGSRTEMPAKIAEALKLSGVTEADEPKKIK